MPSIATSRASQSYYEISRHWRTLTGAPKALGCYKQINPTTYPAFQLRRRYLQPPRCLHQNTINHDQRNKTIDKFKESLNFEDTSCTPIQVQKLALASSGEQQVVVHGYLGARKDLSKKLSFVSLKDPLTEYTVQIVSSPTDATRESHTVLKSIRPHEPVLVTGLLRPKLPSEAKGGNGDSIVQPEILLQDIKVLNTLAPDIIIKDGAEYGPERRALRLRTDSILREALSLRSMVARLCERALGIEQSTAVETPLLFKSTSEGANEFVVPTRRKGFAYALPQSPQQFKQILMSSGIGQYHQFAKCFRDEDLRADRQPEFTQLDMEKAFATGTSIKSMVERAIIVPIWETFLDVKLTRPFRQLTYSTAMSEYGSDKPDLRIPYKIHPMIQEVLPSELVGKISPLAGPIVDAMVVPLDGSPNQVRTLVSDFLDSIDASRYHNNPDGGPGIFIYDSSKPLQGLSAFGFEAVEKIENTFSGLKDGHLLVLQARKNAPLSGGSTELGQMRIALHSAAVKAGLLPPLPWRYFEPLWVVDFPLFSPSTDDEPGQGGQTGFKSTHHPFTSPRTAADVDLLMTDPTSATGDHYDLVINGEEIGGGSRRIHQAAMQEFIFRDILKMDEAKIADFAPLLEALRAACPPHAGIALGFDRLVAMVFSHLKSRKFTMRDVIAFPKSGSGEDATMKSPGQLTDEQLQRYHLNLRD